MSQDAGIDLETSLGYLLKEASSALRAAMEDVLRPLGMTVTHYSCLELRMLGGLTEAERASAYPILKSMVRALKNPAEDV